MPKGVWLSLRSKGVLAFVALVAYLILVGFLMAQQREKLRGIVDELEQVHAAEESLARINTSIAHVILSVNEAYYTPNWRKSVDGIALDMEAIQSGLRGLRPRFPELRGGIVLLDHNIKVLRSAPGRAGLIDLRDSLHSLVTVLDHTTRTVRDRRGALSGQYRLVYDSITLIALIMGLVGLVVFGGFVTLFFTRVAWDIRKLQARAMEVVTGYRGAPLEVTRRDEVGRLMDAVNRMQLELRKREKQLEISRQQRFHQEKMAAVGSLAAAIAHEINNPIAAISGVAESIHEIRSSLRCPNRGTICRPDLILEQTKRISLITRQLAEMTAPRSHEPQLLDLNGLVRSTCGFIGYDKRFRNVDLVLDLHPQLPAINAVADHLTQVLMNLLINAADAMEGITMRKPTVTVATRALDDRVIFSVTDNGCGMDEQTLARAFEEAFTTKPVGKGSGLGLFMCKLLLAGVGGRIDLDSTYGSGTRATVQLPLSDKELG